jgi:hypothetical protein
MIQIKQSVIRLIQSLNININRLNIFIRIQTQNIMLQYI